MWTRFFRTVRLFGARIQRRAANFLVQTYLHVTLKGLPGVRHTCKIGFGRPCYRSHTPLVYCINRQDRYNACAGMMGRGGGGGEQTNNG